MTRTCRHCQARRVNKPRGLCIFCYNSPGVRDRYPPVPPERRTAAPSPPAEVTLPPPTAPTWFRPGTEAKLLVLIARAERGEAMWHPADDGMDAVGDAARVGRVA